jgi:hypothetical protein
LCIIFEDYRLETDALLSMRGTPFTKESEFKQFYYVRRSLVTLYAFRDCLNDLCNDPEYINSRAFIEAKHFADISQAQKFLNKNDILRAFRNDLGAHLNPEMIKAAIEHYGADAHSSAGWESNDEAFTLKMPFATDLLRGAFASRLPGGISQLKTEMEAFFVVMVEAMKRMAVATHALMLVFLWDRFGGVYGKIRA